MTKQLQYADAGNGTQFNAEGKNETACNYSQFTHLEIFVRLYDIVASFVLDLEHALPNYNPDYVVTKVVGYV